MPKKYEEMSVGEGLIEGLSQALDYAKGKKQGKSKSNAFAICQSSVKIKK